jgi:hypothetical protein
MRQHSLVVVAAFAIGATMASGIAVAASGGQAKLKACESKSGTLGLRATAGHAKGKCAHGFSPISINSVGPKGPPGGFSAANVKLVLKVAAAPANEEVTVVVSCPTNQVAISGGAAWSSSPGDGEFINDKPALTGNTPTGWSGSFVNELNVEVDGTVWAMCAK